MDGLSELLDTGDKVASVTGAVAAVIALAAGVTAGRRRSRRVDVSVQRLLELQAERAVQHRYRFFFGHVPTLSDILVDRHLRAITPTDELHWTGPVDQALAGSRHVVVLGEAGAGKTTLVGQLVQSAITDIQAKRHARIVAVRVGARDLLGRSWTGALAHAIKRDLAVTVAPHLFASPPVRGGRWRVVIDGVDEVTGGSRSHLLWQLRDLLKAAPPHVQLLIASRPLPEQQLADLTANAACFNLRPFDEGQLRTFAEKWFKARRPDDHASAQSSAGVFLARIAGARLDSVVRIPLLATVAALVFEQQEDVPLPTGRAQLYERFITHLLEGSPKVDELRQQIDAELRQRGHAGMRLAQWWQTDFHRHLHSLLNALGSAEVSAPGTDLLSASARWLAGHAPHDITHVLPDGQRLIQDLLESTGLLRLERGQPTFVHQSFAEFLAAKAEAPAFDSGRWLERIADPTYRSIGAFAAGLRSDSDALVAAVLTNGDIITAGDLVADGVPVDEGTRRRVLDELAGLVRHNDERTAEALRVLRDLGTDPHTVRLLSAIAADGELPELLRAVVAEMTYDLDNSVGTRLLRTLAASTPGPGPGWAARALVLRGLETPPPSLQPQDTTNAATGNRDDALAMLGTFERMTLALTSADPRIDQDFRFAAAANLAQSGETAPLRELATRAGITAAGRVAAAGLLSALGDDSTLLELASAPTTEGEYAYDQHNNILMRLSAVHTLLERDHPDALQLLYRAGVAALPMPAVAYITAARLSEHGDCRLQALLVASASPVAAPAARHLALVAPPQVLTILAAREGVPDQARLWLYTGLLRRGDARWANALATLLRNGTFPHDACLPAHAELAAAGTAESISWLRRRATSRIRNIRIRIVAAHALAEADAPTATAVLTRISRSRLRGIRRRRHAATVLAQLTGDRTEIDRLNWARGWQARHRAAVEALETLGDSTKLTAILTNGSEPTRHRISALDRLPRPRHQGFPQLGQLLDDRRTPARLLIELASQVHADDAVRVLSRLIIDQRLPIWHWARAAADASEHGPLHAQLADVAHDPRIGRLRRLVVIAVLGEAGYPEPSIQAAYACFDRRPGEGALRNWWRVLTFPLPTRE